jgi:hypothetical protein
MTLSSEDIRSTIVKDGVQFIYRNIAVLGVIRGMNVSSEESSLNNIFERLLKMASKSVGAVLTDRINCYGMILIIKVWNSLGGSNQSHLY